LWRFGESVSYQYFNPLNYPRAMPINNSPSLDKDGYYIRREIAEKDGIFFIMRAIKANKDQAGLLEMAFFALGNLCTMNGTFPIYMLVKKINFISLLFRRKQKTDGEGLRGIV